MKSIFKEFLEAGINQGDESKKWNSKMFPYIYSKNENKYELDLLKSYKALSIANIFCKKASKDNKTFLFVGTTLEASYIIKEEAERSNSFFINKVWTGGLLTNWSTSKKRIKYLNNLENNNSFLNSISKKELSKKRKELKRLNNLFSGVKFMKKLPDIVIIVGQNNEITAIKECLALNIPTISIVDTDCNPELVTIPIPGNDDSVSSIRYIINSLANSIILGKKISKNYFYY